MIWKKDKAAFFEAAAVGNFAELSNEAAEDEHDRCIGKGGCSDLQSGRVLIHAKPPTCLANEDNYAHHRRYPMAIRVNHKASSA